MIYMCTFITVNTVCVGGTGDRSKKLIFVVHKLFVLFTNHRFNDFILVHDCVSKYHLHHKGFMFVFEYIRC